MRTIILLIFYLVLAVLMAPLILLGFLVKTRKPVVAFGRWVFRVGGRILGIGIEVSGLERFDHRSSYVFMSNHASLLDGPLLFMLIPQPVRVILKKSVFSIPVLGGAMRQAGFIPVDRKGERRGKKNIENAVRMMREQGDSFLIFPEGTRSRDGRLQRFRRGGFFLAVMSGSPIVPVIIKGSFDLMPKGRFHVKKGLIKIEFQAPVPVKGYTTRNMTELIENIRNVIQTGTSIIAS